MERLDPATLDPAALDPAALDPAALTAAQIVSRVHDGRSSAVEVARAHLARIAEREPEIAAFQEHDPERVLAEAAAVDIRPDRFALPLAGVPVAVPDDVDVAGYATRHGSTATTAAPARRNGDLVKRLRKAGAVVIGKTRMSELGAWAVTQSAVRVSRNPLDPALDPGGPAGGAAAAVAAGMAAVAFGTDGGGIRVPAACCGLVGLATGADERWCGVTAIGPIARTAEDAAMLLAVLAGRPVDLELPGPRRVALSLGLPTPGCRLHPDHRAAAVGAATRLLAGPGGARVVVADPPYPRGLHRQWRRCWQAGVASGAAALEVDLRAVDRRTAAVVRKGRRVLRKDVSTARPRASAPAEWRDRVLAWLDEGGYDLLITPATAGPPVQAGVLARRGYRRSMRLTAALLPYATAWSLAGLPAAVAPVVIAGRPVGVQLVGRPGAEAALLAAAARLERQAVPTAGAAPVRMHA